MGLERVPVESGLVRFDGRGTIAGTSVLVRTCKVAEEETRGCGKDFRLELRFDIVAR